MISVSPKAPRRALKSTVKLATVSLISLTIAAGAVTPAQAVFMDPNLAERIEFVLECKKLLIEDVFNGTNIHTEICGVGDISGGPIHHIRRSSPSNDHEPVKCNPPTQTYSIVEVPVECGDR